ncbi:ABC transporter substrate-binding protein [Pelagibius litoralis]|uniref:ABC transporter substrate-binding protein n=1 Tax=Pelagibius litoralis TaxID=374515 RepID=A0A967F262_9PROT|nr:ABC transporter substrate-binding protein [Pelagibius litoralis]NIA71545.1 ABC transporter substrate-binding protein [Pelagibius litoralis]
MRRRIALLPLLAACLTAALGLSAQAAEDRPWNEIVAAGKGQTVYWNAWGGDERINAYIAWVGERVWDDYGIMVRHVKLADTADAVSRVLAERAGGKTDGGSIDLIWINGENFATMKENSLLYGPFTEALPNFQLVDFEDKPSTLVDFTVAADGLEAPWGMAKLNFIYDSARVAETPGSIPALLDWAKARPGRFTYPTPPDFIGTTFLKQVLTELAPDAAFLQQPVADDAQVEQVARPLWEFLDALHPHLWRGGKIFPASGPAQRQLLDDGEVDIALSFYPSEASSAIANALLPETARTFVLDRGTIGNTHFVAIPFNANATEGALVVANFLMGAEAQARKQNPDVWGDDTVLAMAKLDDAGRALFDNLPSGLATLAPEDLGPTLLEPHPSWMTRIEAEWQRRYAR